MIPRYSRPEMAAIWSPETRFRIWFEIEAHAADAMAKLGIVPKAAAKKIWDKGGKARFDVARIDEIERETKHDVIAFLTHLAEIVGPEARFVHSGMTSSDVLDTCFNVQLVRAADILVADVDRLLAALKKRAFEHKKTPTIGRSHGIHAEPTTFGVKLAVAYAEFARAKRRLIAARTEVATCAISGAVGTFAQIDPRVEAHVAKAMGLAVEPVSTQIIPRDRHAMFFATLGVVASSMERLAIEIRHLQRTEVLEAEEFFSEGQKGSSAMPHKRNPVLTENITGLARMVRSYALPAMENVALWHERDISHSSVERMIGPDSTVTLDFALNRLAGVIEKLVVYPGNMQKNLDRLGGLVHSQRVLIALTKAGMSREDAYKLVQKHAMQVWQGKGDFLTLLKGDKAGAREAEARRDREELRPRPPLQARRHDLQARVREELGHPLAATQVTQLHDRQQIRSSSPTPIARPSRLTHSPRQTQRVEPRRDRPQPARNRVVPIRSRTRRRRQSLLQRPGPFGMDLDAPLQAVRPDEEHPRQQPQRQKSGQWIFRKRRHQKRGPAERRSDVTDQPSPAGIDPAGRGRPDGPCAGATSPSAATLR